MNAPGPGTDRSVPRQCVRDGATAHDRRGLRLDAPAILQYGFRPFFLLAALHAGLAVPLWLLMYSYGYAPAGPFTAMQWHAHEMVFGYVGAVIAGFILTAVPNWTGRLPLSGGPLAVLVALWLAGRLANAGVGNAPAAMLIDLSFPTVLVGAILREILAGGNWRNLPVVLMLALLAAANLMHHLEAAGYLGGDHALRLGLGAMALLIALIGGRITPSFTRNWLAKRGDERLPASFSSLDRSALAITAISVLLWVVWPERSLTGLLLVASGALLSARLSRWRGLATLSEPILLILHLGYAWLGLAMFLIGAAILFPGTFVPASALHALTAGAAATMTLAVMTRASLGHTGRAIRADAWTVAIYIAVTAGALLRVVSPYLAGSYLLALTAAGALWTLAFLIFALRYGPILATRRR
jgi:uncharacterized protein involved in response to NO